MKNEEQETLKKYLSKSYVYFHEPDFNNEALALFNESMHIYQRVVSERSFGMKKKLLDWQLSFLAK